MTPLALYGVLGAASLTALGLAHWSGRLVCDAKHAAAERDAAVAAGAAKDADEDLQRDAGRQADDQLTDEITRLRRQLERRDDDDDPITAACGEPGDGDRVFDAYDELFDAGLPAGGEGDDARGSAAGAALDEGRNRER